MASALLRGYHRRWLSSPSDPPSLDHATAPTLAADAPGSEPSLETVAGPTSLAAPTEAPLLAGRYRILGLLGSGGMGNVYRALDAQLDEVVALKLLRRELSHDLGMAARFRQEVRLARKVTHRNVARTFDLGEHEGALFLTMELLDGESLGARLQRSGALPVDEAIAIALDVAAALSAAHAAGVVHRDLKPDNVLLAKDGRAVVTDFGIARPHDPEGSGAALRTQGLVGTPAYMAPEQVEGGAVDGRADLYALGELLFEMLTGRRAWPAPSALAAAASRLTEDPPDPRRLSPSVSAGLAQVTLRLLARRPADRFATASEAAAALREASSSLPAASLAPTLLPAVAAAPRPGLQPAHGEKTVAVLPFKNLGVEPYLVDGVLEDLIDTLSMTSSLRVRPSGVTRRHRDSSADPRDIGRELGVQVVVEGSVRPVPAGLRVSVRAFGVEDGFQLWARRFDRPAADLMVVSDEAARAIAEALTTGVAGPARDEHADPAVAERYLRARAELKGAWHVTDRIAHVASLFDEALAHGGRDPLVLAGAALAHARVSYYGGPPAQRHADKAKELADRAIALAPQLAEPWVALATLRREARDDVGAVRVLHSAIRVAPRSAKVRELLGRVVLEAGALDVGLAELRASIELDPSNDEPRWDFARGLALQGDFTAAFEALRAPAETDSARVMRAYVGTRLAVWNLPHGSPRFAPVPGEGLVPSSTAALRRVLETRAVSEADRRFFAETADASGSRMRSLLRQILVEIELSIPAPEGEPVERAFDHLRRAVTSDLCDVAWMDGCPLLAPLRSDGRWDMLRAVVENRASKVRAAAYEARTEP